MWQKHRHAFENINMRATYRQQETSRVEAASTTGNNKSKEGTGPAQRSAVPPPPPAAKRNMSATVADRCRGALWGACIGDALAMPSHWYYGGASQVKQDYGEIKDYVSALGVFVVVHC